MTPITFILRNRYQTPQSPAEQAEILRQTDILLEDGIIERSHYEYCCQILMVPRPDARMCVDYRNLDDCVVTKV
jgi:hypothetical protein